MHRTSARHASDPKHKPFTIPVILALFLAFAGPVAARESTDVITMKNGDRLTGTIKRLEAGVLYFGLDYADGDVSIEWAKVARVESKQLFIVKMQDGSVFVGNLRTAPKTKGNDVTRLEIVETAEAENPVTIDKSQVADMRQTADEFWRRLSGGVSFGSSYSKGNNAAQYNLGFDTAYQRERWGAQANLTSNLSSSSGTAASTRNMLALGAYQLLPWKNYFYGGLGSFLQSSVQGINLQTSLGGGIGRFLKNTNRSQISVMGGLAWQSTDYRQSDVSLPKQNVISGLVAVNLSLFKFSKTNLTVTGHLFPALSEPGRVRFDTNASYFVKVFGDLSWTISFYGNWDTRPPPHFSGSDYGTASGVSWTFGK
jgi:hypothetical protein